MLWWQVFSDSKWFTNLISDSYDTFIGTSNDRFVLSEDCRFNNLDVGVQRFRGVESVEAVAFMGRCE